MCRDVRSLSAASDLGISLKFSELRIGLKFRVRIEIDVKRYSQPHRKEAFDQIHGLTGANLAQLLIERSLSS